MTTVNINNVEQSPNGTNTAQPLLEEHLTDRQQESGLKLNTARGMFCPLLLVSSVFVSLLSLIVRKEGKNMR